jgi:hypothetical protein
MTRLRYAGVVPKDVMRNLGSSNVPPRVCGLEMAERIRQYQSKQKVEYMDAFTAVTNVVPMQPDKVANYSIDDKTDTLERR